MTGCAALRRRGRRLVLLVAVLGAVGAVQVSGVGATAPPPLVAAGDNHSCAAVNGAAYCWGYGPQGQLGNGHLDPVNGYNSEFPVLVTGLSSGVSAITAGGYFSCAIVNHAAKCWGENDIGQLGNGTQTYVATPVQVSGMTSGVTAISGSYKNACAIKSGGAWCWGLNDQDELGNGLAPTPSFTPARVTGLSSGVTAISAGMTHSCAIQNGAAKCWGFSGTNDGLSGLGDADGTRESGTPVQVAGLTSGVTAITAGTYHSCAIQNGAAYCWGWGADAELGIAAGGYSSLTPYPVTGLSSGVTAISASHHSYWTCAVVNGGVQCWGTNPYGGLGEGSSHTGPRYAPVQVLPAGSGATDIAVGWGHACAAVNDTVECWGTNWAGMLGDGTFVDRWGPGGIADPVDGWVDGGGGGGPADTTPPVVTVPADITAGATSAAGATVTFAASASDPDDDPGPVACDPASGATFPVGTTTVTCSATDTNGNTGSASFTVTVTDATAPVVTVPASISVGATSPAGAAVTFTVSASDPDDAAGPVTCTSGSGSTFPIGTTTVTCSSTDTHGNTGSGSFTVTVTDTTAPVVHVPADISAGATSAAGAAVTFAVSASDPDDAAGPATCTRASGSTFPIGTTNVTCSSTDTHGNTGSASFTVTVQSTARSLTQLALAGATTLASGAGKPDADQLKDAIKKLSDAADGSNWVDGNTLVAKGGEQVFDQQKDAAHKLSDLIKNRKSAVSDASLQALVDDLTGSASMLATAAVASATAGGGDAKKLGNARDELAKAADALAKGKLDEAFDHWKNAWKQAGDSLKK